jgi:hypothetical protein
MTLGGEASDNRIMCAGIKSEIKVKKKKNSSGTHVARYPRKLPVLQQL